jgi:hypothetical protein
MLFVSDDELRQRLPEVVHKTIFEGRGRPAGKETIPFEVKAAISAYATVVGPTVASQVFDICEGEASKLKNGIISQNNGKNEALKAARDSRLGVIHNAALEKLLLSIESIDDDKIREAKPRDQVAIAEGLAGVFEKTSEKGNQINAGQVIIYAPRQNTLDDYEASIDITPVKNQ